MAHKVTVPCAQCGAECNRWRQCPEKGCAHDVAFCEACGGDERAVERMRLHVGCHTGES